MKSLDDAQIATLTLAIVQGYPAALGQAQLKMMLRSIGIDFDARIVPNATFELTLNDILLNLNKASDLDRFFTQLDKDPRPAVQNAIAALLAVPPEQRRPIGFDELSRALLIVEGDPFVDHEDLASSILPKLLSRTEPLRAVVMTGPTDCGKTFSLGLIRELCRSGPIALRFRPIAIDLAALSLTRDCMQVARMVGNWLKLDQFKVEMDTSETRIGRRLVAELSVARELAEHVVPTLLVFDHLDKDVAPGIIDFVEELALAAANGGLRDVRVVLIGFPRAPATTFPLGKLVSDIVVQPNPALLFQYLDRALEVLDRDMDDTTLENLVNDVFAGQQQPYPRSFMLELPEKIRGILRNIIEAPTS